MQARDQLDIKAGRIRLAGSSEIDEVGDGGAGEMKSSQVINPYAQSLATSLLPDDFSVPDQESQNATSNKEPCLCVKQRV